MNWYLAKLVYRIVCGNGNHVAQFDEQLRLVGAAGKEEAFRKAYDTGIQGQDCFSNLEGQLVQWQFVNVSELYALGLIDGAEISSRINEVEDAQAYASFVHHKAAQIRNEITNPLLTTI
jgi:hypothetical protein